MYKPYHKATSHLVTPRIQSRCFKICYFKVHRLTFWNLNLTALVTRQGRSPESRTQIFPNKNGFIRLLTYPIFCPKHESREPGVEDLKTISRSRKSNQTNNRPSV